MSTQPSGDDGEIPVTDNSVLGTTVTNQNLVDWSQVFVTSTNLASANGNSTLVFTHQPSSMVISTADVHHLDLADWNSTNGLAIANLQSIEQFQQHQLQEVLQEDVIVDFSNVASTEPSILTFTPPAPPGALQLVFHTDLNLVVPESNFRKKTQLSKPNPRPKKPKLPTKTKTVDLEAVKDKLTCSICKKIFATTGSLRRHEITHSADPQPFCCDICNRKFTQISTLGTHKKEAHEGLRDRFECHICHQKFTRGSGLKTHLKNLHPQKENSGLDGTSGSADEKPLRKRAMLDPNRQPTPKWDLTECPVCQKKFKKARYCRRHMFIHTGERPFKCPHCDKTCYREDDLKSHVESHLDIRKYVSKYCSRSFRRKKDMKYHEKVHEESGICITSSQKLRSCKICSEAFGSAFLFKQHFMQKHNRNFVIPLGRTKIQPVDPNNLPNDSPGDFGLCIMCGNWFTEEFYRVHRALCDIENGIITDAGFTEPEPEVNEITADLNSMSTEITDGGNCETKTEPGGTSQDEKREWSIWPTEEHFDDQVDLPFWDDDNNSNSPILPGNSLKQVPEDEDMKPTILDLDSTLQSCKLCFNVIRKSDYMEHVYQKHNKNLLVKICKTLFKPLLRNEFRSICEVRASPDTMNIPWYMCAKCGHIFAIKTRAKFHKVVCRNKDRFSVVIRETSSARGIPPLDEESESGGVAVSRKIIGAVRDEHWTENWTEDILPDDTKVTYKNIRVCEDGRAECLLCNKYFKDEPGARAHMVVHREKKWVCTYCGVTFVWKELYKAHVRKHTGEKPYPCRICGKPHREQVGRFVHEKTHLSVEERRQLRAKKMEAKRLKKEVGECEPKRKTKERKFLCSICASIFSTKIGLKRHTIVIHPADGIKPKFFDCKLCPRSYSLVSSIKSHLRKEHARVLPELLITKDSGLDENNISLNIENYFVRKNRELKRLSDPGNVKATLDYLGANVDLAKTEVDGRMPVPDHQLQVIQHHVELPEIYHYHLVE